jgi:serine/threonine protein kinase
MRRCRNIIRLIEVYDSELQVQIVMTYADLGTLKNIYIADQTPLPEDEVKPIMQQLL